VFIDQITVKLSNLNKISNRTELYRTNSILSRRTVSELFRIFWLFLIIFVFFCKKFGSIEPNRSTENITRMHHIQLILKFGPVRSNRTFYKKNTKIIKKFECGSPWRTYVFNSLRFGKRLTFDSFTVFSCTQFRHQDEIILII